MKEVDIEGRQWLTFNTYTRTHIHQTGPKTETNVCQEIGGLSLTESIGEFHHHSKPFNESAYTTRALILVPASKALDRI